MKAWKWILPFVALGLLIGLSWVIPIASFLDPEQLSLSLKELGWVGPLALMGLMTLAVVISPIPSLPIDVAAGAAYGPLWGSVYVIVGAEIGAIISFLISRLFGKHLVGPWISKDLVFCERCSDHHLMGLVIMARLLPVFSFDIVSYGAGLTGMSLRAFALATFVGMIPPTVAFTYFGSAVVSVDWPVILLSLLLIMFLLLLPRLIMRNRSSAWVRMLQGKPTKEGADGSSAVKGKEGHRSCGWCGADTE